MLPYRRSPSVKILRSSVLLIIFWSVLITFIKSYGSSVLSVLRTYRYKYVAGCRGRPLCLPMPGFGHPYKTRREAGGHRGAPPQHTNYGRARYLSCAEREKARKESEG